MLKKHLRYKENYHHYLKRLKRTMANHTSSKKAIRQIAFRTAVNKNRISRVRTFVKNVENLLPSTTVETAVEALRSAQKELMRAVTKGVIHKNTASRKISRLSARIKTLAN